MKFASESTRLVRRKELDGGTDIYLFICLTDAARTYVFFQNHLVEEFHKKKKVKSFICDQCGVFTAFLVTSDHSIFFIIS